MGALAAAPVKMLGMVSAMIVNTARRFDHHFAKSVRIEPCAAQHRGHNLVIEQILEARFIAAAFCATVHDPLLVYHILRSLGGNRVRFMTGVRKLRGNLLITTTIFPFKRNVRDRRLFPFFVARDAA
jgi:hypothetical protein